MIVRIMGHGQIELPDDFTPGLITIDRDLLVAIEAGDEAGFETALAALHDILAHHGKQVAPDHIGVSSLVVPEAGTTLAEAHRMLDHGDLPFPGTSEAPL
ncbi:MULTISPECIES: PspA-associated protein PspAA [unclassified Acidiphilium]|uniref:PspA-associated protein PspAA n=1 Tax=unclassified Acidiphilium TaxID=2617493 RepID=UPI000BD26133|nr:MULTISPECIES: hypothetical protein [unclassified Acidiphilium]MCW8309125.1 hypothetical protein [Acidiphilium sp. PA]OZB27470.1 MAG: hypothetical protein B7X49_10790 [Acidiphilium sp. 34-64-41]